MQVDRVVAVVYALVHRCRGPGREFSHAARDPRRDQQEESRGARRQGKPSQQGFSLGDLEGLTSRLLTTEPFRRPGSEDDRHQRHGWHLQISFWDGTTLGRQGTPLGSYEVAGALQQWLSAFNQAERRAPTICDTGPPDAPVADETHTVAEVALDAPVSRRALAVLTPLVTRSGVRAQRADGSTVMAALDHRIAFSLPTGLVTDPSWLYWAISWRFHDEDKPWAWGIMRVAKAGGKPELTVAFEDPAAALQPHAGRDHGYRLLGVDETSHYLEENVGPYCPLLWRLPPISPVRSAFRHYAYWFNTDRHSIYTIERDRIMRRVAGHRIDLGPRIDLYPLSGHLAPDGRYLYGCQADSIWRIGLGGGKRIRLAPMREDVPTSSPLKMDARWLYFYRYSSGPTYYFFRAPKSGGNTERLFQIGPAQPIDFVVTDRWICWCARGAAVGVYCGDKEHGPATRVSPSQCAALATDDRWIYWLDDLERVVAKKPLPGP